MPSRSSNSAISHLARATARCLAAEASPSATASSAVTLADRRRRRRSRDGSFMP